MRHHFLRLGRQTVVYGLSGAMPALFGLLILPVVARHMTTAEYGVLELAITTIAVAALLVELGLTSASQRSYFDYSDDQPGPRRVVLFTAMVTYTAGTVVAAAILIAARVPVSEFLFNSSNEGDVVVIAAASLPALALVNFSREVMRLHFRVWQFLASSAAAAVVGTGAILVALLALNLNVTGVLLGTLIGSAVAGVYGMIVVRRDVGGGFSWPELRTMLDYGLPLVPMAAALWALALIDRLMLSKISSLSEVGEYGMANRVGLMLTLAATAFATAYSPFMLSLYSEDPEEEKLVRARLMTYVAITFGVLTVVLSLFAREAFKVIAPNFDSAYEAVGLVAYGLAVYGIANIAVGGISLARRTRSLIVLSGTAAAVNIVVNLVLIPPWGMLGAAFATAVAYVLLFALYYLYAQRVYHTRYELARLIRLGLLTAAATAVGAIPIEPLSLSVAVKLAVLVVYLLGLRLAGVVRGEDLTAMRLMVRERLAA